MSTSSVFDMPAKKLFVTDLQDCVELPNLPKGDSPGANMKTWQSNCSGTMVTFSVVTVQGTVVKVNAGDDSLCLDDGTAIVSIKGCSKIPFCSVKPEKGQYLMVVGQLHKSGTSPVMRAMKVQNLTDDVTLTIMWPLEVIDQLAQSR